jgi:UDPglucose 6-dehydrogenase
MAKDADALIVVTEWREFRELDLKKLAEVMATPVLIDGRNIYHPQAAANAGFDYSGIGRCLPASGVTRSAVLSERSGS